MRIDTAILLAEQITYKPGWYFVFGDNSNRFEDTITVEVHANTFRTEREDFDNQEPVDARSSFVVSVGDCNSPDELYRRIFDQAIMATELHEAREFFRIRPTLWAPFHPHKTDGMKRWGTVASDLTYGLV